MKHKVKTHKSLSKRIIKITKSGKLMRLSMSAQHRVTGKSHRSRQGANNASDVSSGDIKRIKQLLPYLN